MINTLLSPLVKLIPQNNRIQRIWKLSQVDYKKRFYNSQWGVLWSLFNPLARLLIYYLVFQFLIPQNIENYALYLFSGILIWMFFSECTRRGFRVFISKKYLIESIQFNWLDLFYSLALGVFWGFVFNFLAYFLLSYTIGVDITLNYLYFPFYILNIFVLTLAVTIILAILSLYVVDIIHIWDLVLLAGFWSAPILFRGETILEKFPLLAFIHPFTGLIINVRKSILYNEAPDMFFLIYNFVLSFSLLIFSLFLFKKLSRRVLERI